MTKETLYKEVKLNDGNILFTSISVSEPTTSLNSLSPKVNATNAQQTLNMTSSQGVKNIFGYTLYKLDYTTVWTYDFSTVVSSYSNTSVENGVDWSFKSAYSNGPDINDSGREHQWTGTAAFLHFLEENKNNPSTRPSCLFFKNIYFSVRKSVAQT